MAARRALAEAAAATAILLDRDAWPRSAAVHLREGWLSLLEAQEAGRDEARARPLAERLEGTRSSGLSGSERREVAEILSRLEGGGAPDTLPERVTPSALRRNARFLHAEAVRTLRERGEGRARWKWIAAGAAAVVVGLVAVWGGGAADPGEDASASGWLGRYYPQPSFGGDPVIRYDEAIDFEWLDRPPVDGVPKDGYSVRWDACLDLPSTDTLELRLGSDDGSRLFIDGEQVIDNWRDQAGNWMSYTAELEEGVHHLRVEYYESGGDALAILNVTSPSGPVPPDMLRPPRLRGGEVVCAR